MRISDWSSDVCSSDLRTSPPPRTTLFSWALGSSGNQSLVSFAISRSVIRATLYVHPTSHRRRRAGCRHRSEEHTSELQSLMRISYAVFCLKKKKKKQQQT